MTKDVLLDISLMAFWFDCDLGCVLDKVIFLLEIRK